MNAARRGIALILVVVVVALIGMFGVLVTQLSRGMLREHARTETETAARQLVVSGLAWAQVNLPTLREAGDWIDLPADRLVEPPADASLRVRLGQDEPAFTIVVVDVRVQRSKAAVSRTVRHRMAATAASTTSRPVSPPS